MTVEIPLQQDTIDNVSLSVFMTMFGLQGTPEPMPDQESDEEVVASIGINGDWSGTVWVGVPRPLLVQILEFVHELDPSDICEDSVKDTIAELTNMIGGGLKALLPGNTSLSLPSHETAPRGDRRAYSVDGHKVLIWIDPRLPSTVKQAA